MAAPPPIRPNAVRVARRLLVLAIVVVGASLAAAFYESFAGFTDNPEIADRAHGAQAVAMVLAALAFVVAIAAFGAQLGSSAAISIRRRVVQGLVAVAIVAGLWWGPQLVGRVTTSPADGTPGTPAQATPRIEVPATP